MVFGSKKTIYKLEQVFIPGGQPSVTYVDRAELGLEAALKKAVALPNHIVSLTGATKSGKTVLCKSVLSSYQYIWIDGGQTKSEDDLWLKICNELSLASEWSTKASKGDQLGTTGGFEVNLGLPGSGIKFGVTANGSRLQSSETVYRYLPSNIHQSIDFLINNKICLVIDDFHFIDEHHRAKRVLS